MVKRFGLRLLRLLEIAGWVTGIVCLGSFVAVKIDARLYNMMQKERLERAWKPDATGDPGALDGREISASLHHGDLVGWIDIPRVGVSAAVAEGTTSDVLRDAVGHIPGTAVPPERGNMALAGHRDSFFRGLREIRKGDRIEIETPDGTFHYRVDSADIVDPSDVVVLRRGHRAELTLVTCYPFHWIGNAPHRFVVRASPAVVEQ